MTGFSGSCLCGKVKYHTSSDPLFAGHCYCDDCRKTSGTSHATHILVPEDSVTLQGDVKAYERLANSGHPVIRHFCTECGSAIYNTNPTVLPDMIVFRASSIAPKDQPKLKPSINVFTSSAPKWAKIDEALPSFSEMPPPADMPDEANT